MLKMPSLGRLAVLLLAGTAMVSAAVGVKNKYINQEPAKYIQEQGELQRISMADAMKPEKPLERLAQGLQYPLSVEETEEMRRVLGPEYTDVIVVGAGTTGVPAAISAARHGAEVNLLEKSHWVGGIAVGGFVTIPCRGPVQGIFKEFIDTLDSQYGQRVWHEPVDYMHMLEDKLSEAEIHVVTDLTVDGVIKEGNKVVGVRGHHKKYGEVEYRAEIVVDATGYVVAKAAGVETRYGEDSGRDFQEPHAPNVRSSTTQKATQMFILRRDNSPRGIDRGLPKLFRKPRTEEGQNTNWLWWAGTVECNDFEDQAKLAKAKEEALQRSTPMLEQLKERGYEVINAPLLGVRERTRIVGTEEVVTENTLMSGVLPYDTIALGDSYFDGWGFDDSIRQIKVPGFGISARTLIPKECDGLIVQPGRSHLAHSAIRMQPILASCGEAMGAIAAHCAENNIQPRDVDMRVIQNTLGMGPKIKDFCKQYDVKFEGNLNDP